MKRPNGYRQERIKKGNGTRRQTTYRPKTLPGELPPPYCSKDS
jgi:hypothetical protein